MVLNITPNTSLLVSLMDTEFREKETEILFNFPNGCLKTTIYNEWINSLVCSIINKMQCKWAAIQFNFPVQRNTEKRQLFLISPQMHANLTLSIKHFKKFLIKYFKQVLISVTLSRHELKSDAWYSRTKPSNITWRNS